MDDITLRFWHDMIDRLSGPMSFRLVLQPTVAAILAIKAGISDARTGRPLYFYSMLTDSPERRRRRLAEGFHDVLKVFGLAIVLDCVYQVIVHRWIYPIEALLVAFVLACLPYLLIRGPANRIARRRVPVPEPRT
jgi:hypothetical protein